MSRWLSALIFALLGAAAGVAYGWFIAPVEYVDTIPATLRVDYRSDYVLMAAERFQGDHDLRVAQESLSVLGVPPSIRCEEALAFGRTSGYSDSDLSALNELCRALETSSPASTPTGITP